MRKQVTEARPVVVALLLCAFEELDYVRRYRAIAEAFIDQLFFPTRSPSASPFLPRLHHPERQARDVRGACRCSRAALRGTGGRHYGSPLSD